ncbi:hypothetical protein [Rubrivirga sp.]|uniref:hypothetical protein n=1 Tax=Rubrivirga sp. TaxID=1885344 RepID=UPI003C73A1C7
MRRLLFLVAAAIGLTPGCVPYAVGTTPSTVSERAIEPSAVLQVTSGRRDIGVDTEPGGAGLMLGNEARIGLDERSDIGVRIIGFGSMTATYKRRLTGALGQEAGAAVMVGAGIIGTSHLHVEATVVASPGPLEGFPRIVPYGGVRLQDLTPFSNDALGTPTALGVFVGGRFGWPDLSVSPELGLFYSPSPLLGDDDVIIVPSVTVRGDRLRRALGL